MIKDEYADLGDGNGNVTKVEKQGRTAKCISICLGAFGPLQDRMLIKSIMDEMYKDLLTAEYEGTDKQTIKDVKKFNKDMQRWIPSLKRERINGDPKRNPFFNNWFLDFEQLTLIVKESNSNDGLQTRLIGTKYVTTGPYNFHRECRMVRMMNGNKG